LNTDSIDYSFVFASSFSAAGSELNGNPTTSKFDSLTSTDQTVPFNNGSVGVGVGENDSIANRLNL
jgi:hypothetical protein